MTVLTSAISPGSDEFRTNEQAYRALVEDLREQTAQAAAGGGQRARVTGTPAAASCCRASASTGCSIRGRRCSSCPRSPPTISMRATPRAPGSSPGSAGSRDGSA